MSNMKALVEVDADKKNYIKFWGQTDGVWYTVYMQMIPEETAKQLECFTNLALEVTQE